MLNTIRSEHAPNPDETRNIGSYQGKLIPPHEGTPEHITEYLFSFSNGRSVALVEFTTGTEVWYSLARAQGFPLDWADYVSSQVSHDIFRKMAFSNTNLTSEEINADIFFGELFGRIAGLPDFAEDPSSDSLIDDTDYNALWPSLDEYRIGVSITCLNAQLMPFVLATKRDSDASFRLFHPAQLSELYPLKDRIATLWHELMSFGGREYLRGGFLSYEATVRATKFVTLAENEGCEMTPEQIRTLVNNLRLPSGFVRAVEKRLLK